VVMVVSGLDQAEQLLLGGELPCPHCDGVLRPFGHGRTRIVRGLGSARLTVTPRRARCAGCGRTQILLPTALTVRRADSTEVIGNALVAKAQGAGVRSVAARFDRPESTVRRWFRGAGERHAHWLYRRGIDRGVAIDRELLVNPAPEPTTLGHALNLLIGAAHRCRQRLSLPGSLWSLVGIFVGGRLIPAGRPPRPS
jgi:hypothetical protein